LKDKAELVLGKGTTPAAGKWNNTGLNVISQWFKRDGNKAMPKNKEGIILRYHETHTHVSGMTPKLTLMKMWRQLLLFTATVATVAHSATAGTNRYTHATAGTARSANAHTTQSSSDVAAQDDLTIFDIAAAEDPAAPHANPVNSAMDTNDSTTGGIVAPDVVAPPNTLKWDDCDAPFDVCIQLEFHARVMSLCPLDSDNDDASRSSDEDSIFIDL
jgi:hypothetical protein